MTTRLRCRPSLLACCLALSASGGLAQGLEEQDLLLAYGDRSTVSIATGSKQNLRRAPAVASVITAEDIAAMGATDLDEVLETVPGLHVARSANAYAPLYVMRGIFSQFNPQTLLLQNGVPMTTLFVGNKGNVWGGLPLENVARIEIIRGPGAALYGADAYAGVINIITKTAEDIDGTTAGVRAGSFGTRDAWALHGGSLGPFSVAAYLRLGTTDGFDRSVAADAQTRNDARFGSAASLAPGSVNTGRDAVDAGLDLGLDKWRLRAGYKLRDNVETGAGIASALDPVGRAKSERINADLSWTDAHVAPNLGLGFVVAYLHYTQQTPTDFLLFPPGTSFAPVGGGSFPNGMIGGPDTWERQFRVSAYATYTGFAHHSLRLGLGYEDLDLYKTRETKNFVFTASGIPLSIGDVADLSDTSPFMFPQQRRVSYAYVQDEWMLAQDWTLTAGVRHDSYSDFGSTTNPRLALVWDAAYDLTAKLLYGEAFRAPAFNEQHSINNPVARGNPDLQPETIRTLEAALAWQITPRTQVNLSVFRYRMDDIIRLMPNATPGTGSTYVNSGGQKGSGAELELAWDADRSLRLSANYAYQHAVDEVSNKDAGYAPRNQLYGRADWRFAAGWLLGGQLNWVADRQRAAGDTRDEVPDYTTVDLTLRGAPRGSKWSFAASVRNLFDADVREPSAAPGLIRDDLPMAPRSFYLQAAYSL